MFRNTMSSMPDAMTFVHHFLEPRLKQLQASEQWDLLKFFVPDMIATEECIVGLKGRDFLRSGILGWRRALPADFLKNRDDIYSVFAGMGFLLSKIIMAKPAAHWAEERAEPETGVLWTRPFPVPAYAGVDPLPSPGERPVCWSGPSVCSDSRGPIEPPVPAESGNSSLSDERGNNVSPARFDGEGREMVSTPSSYLFAAKPLVLPPSVVMISIDLDDKPKGTVCCNVSPHEIEEWSCNGLSWTLEIVAGGYVRVTMKFENDATSFDVRHSLYAPKSAFDLTHKTVFGRFHVMVSYR